MVRGVKERLFSKHPSVQYCTSDHTLFGPLTNEQATGQPRRPFATVAHDHGPGVHGLSHVPVLGCKYPCTPYSVLYSTVLILFLHSSCTLPVLVQYHVLGTVGCTYRIQYDLPAGHTALAPRPPPTGIMYESIEQPTRPRYSTSTPPPAPRRCCKKTG